MNHHQSFNAVFFEHIITCKPKNIFCIKKEEVFPYKRDRIQQADDQFVIINENNISFPRMLFLLSFIIVLIGFFISNNYLNILLFASPSLLIGFWYYALYYFNPPKNIILNRLEGTISYPKKYFYKKQWVVSFKETKMFECIEKREVKNFEAMHEPGTRYKNLYLRHPKTGSTLPLLSLDINAHKFGSSLLNKFAETRSFYTWYMDKNRPLPPGSAFDDYREKDFNRRKNEGFLAPLYPSLIATSEAKRNHKEIKKSFLIVK